jgi:hypothetical protein
MRWLDCLLLSTALGATLFTGYVFAVRPLDRDTIHSEPNVVSFRVAVVHESATCARVKESAGGALPCHFFITASGDIIPTAAWKTRHVLRTTRVPRIDDVAISILLESGPSPTRREQQRALQRLLETLRDHDGISLSFVYQHAQVENGGCAVARVP